MKKIILLALMITGLYSCSGITQKKGLIIKNIRQIQDPDNIATYGKYAYGFTGTDLTLCSDSIYSIGDTLKITK